VADGTGDSSARWITEGGDLAGKDGGSATPSYDGGEGVDGLLAAKGGSCDLDASKGEWWQPHRPTCNQQGLRHDHRHLRAARTQDWTRVMSVV
jgi:hypothetical protein